MCVGDTDTRLAHWAVDNPHCSTNPNLDYGFDVRLDRNYEQVGRPHTYTPIVNEE